MSEKQKKGPKAAKKASEKTVKPAKKAAKTGKPAKATKPAAKQAKKETGEKARPVAAKKEKASAKGSEKKKQEPAKKETKKIPKSKEVKALAAKISKKKKRLFRGRFGNRSIRRISNKKWQRWKKPRGIDIYFKQEDGLYPKTGYKTETAIRGKHPSGYDAVVVRNMAELEALKGRKGSAAIIASAVGKRKREKMVEKASEIEVAVLNG